MSGHRITVTGIQQLCVAVYKSRDNESVISVSRVTLLRCYLPSPLLRWWRD